MYPPKANQIWRTRDHRIVLLANDGEGHLQFIWFDGVNMNCTPVTLGDLAVYIGEFNASRWEQVILNANKGTDPRAT